MDNVETTSETERFLKLTPESPKAKFLRGVPAWLLSFGLHTIILITTAFLFRDFYRGSDVIENRSGGIVLVKMESESTEYLSEGEMTDQSESAPLSTAASPPPLPTSQDMPLDIPGLTPSSTDFAGVGKDLVDAQPGADLFAESTTNGGDIGGKVTTEVFGVKGTGTQFIYLFDRSASMEGFDARPIRAAKQQLLASLESLGPSQRFQLIFYNEGIRTFDPDPGPAAMLYATKETRVRAVRFIESIRGDGGTDHIQALKFALRLSPDVIFMLTDAEGGFTVAELRQIDDWNRAGTVINAIEFGDGPKPPAADRSLEKLAKQNRGQYLYKNIATLPD